MKQNLDHEFGKNFIQRINNFKAQLAANSNLLVDGSLIDVGPFDKPKETIADASKASRGWKDLEFLYGLILLHQPNTILELGTNLGISSAYLAAALLATGNNNSIVHTIDASPYRIKVAQDLHAELDLGNIEYYTGLFFDVLPEITSKLNVIDFAFIDGQYALKPSLYFFEEIAKNSREGTLLVFGGIQFSEEMQNAWKTIRNSPLVFTAWEVGGLGMVLIA